MEGVGSEPTLPGKRPYKKSAALLVPKADSSCIACGLCAKDCPVGAIALNNPKATDKSKSISCMRCVAKCPKQARKVNGLLVFVVSLMLKNACSKKKDNELFI